MTTGNRIRTYRDHAELREAAADDTHVEAERAEQAERADRWRRTAGLLPPADLRGQ